MKGFIYMLEALIAGILILTFLSFLATPTFLPPEEGELTLKAYELLQGLDDQGILRHYAVTEDVAGLNAQIRFFSANHSVQICDKGGQCQGSIPNGTNVFSGTYLVAGNTSYDPHYVRLFLWRS